MHSKMIAAKPDARHTPQEAPLYTVFISSHTRAGTLIVSESHSATPTGPDRRDYPSRYRRVIAKVEQETDIAAAE